MGAVLMVVIQPIFSLPHAGELMARGIRELFCNWPPLGVI
jgi:hypothetical protein